MNEKRNTIDQLSEKYCDLWRQNPTSVEDFLNQSSLSEDDSKHLTIRLIKHEIELRRSTGQSCAAGEYQKRFPHLDGEVLANLFSMPAPPPSSVLKPLLPGRYQPIKQIGKGGIGSVWQVEDRDMERTLAVKVLHSKLEKETSPNLRLKREAMLTGSLQHPGIPPVFEYGSLVGGSNFFAMKLVEGETLDRVLSKLSQTELLSVFRQIAEAVGFAHSKNVIHRDLKPQNVMVGAFGEVQIMDWGMARRLDRDEPAPAVNQQPFLNGSKTDTVSAHCDESVSEKMEKSLSHELTRVGEILGTPAYMAPEQARGESDRIDARSDVFGLGAILFAMLTGKRLYDGHSAADMISVAAKGDLESAFLALSEADLDDELRDLCKDCLQPQSCDRPADASVVAERIGDYQNSVRSRLRQAELNQRETSVKAEEQRKRRRIVSWLCGLAILLTTTGLIGVTWQWNKTAEARFLAVERLGETREAVDEFYSTVSKEGGMLALNPGTAEIRKKLLSKAKDYYTNFVTQFADDEDAWLEMAKAYDRLILISAELEPASDEVFVLIEQQKELLAKLIARNDANANSSDYHRLRQGAQYRLVQQLSHKGEHERAIKESKTCAEYIEDWIAVDDSFLPKLQAAKNLHNIGREKRILRRHEEAFVDYSEALRLAEPLWDTNREDSQCAFNFATMNNSVAVHYGWYAKPRDAQKAIIHLKKSVEIMEGMIERDPKKLENKRQLTSFLSNLGMLLWNDTEGEKDGEVRAKNALAAYERSIAISRELVRDHPSVPVFRSVLAKHLSSYSSYQGLNGNPEKQLESLRSASNIGYNVAIQHPKVERYTLKGIQILEQLAALRGLVPEGKEAAKKSLELFAQRSSQSDSHSLKLRWALRKSIVEKTMSPMLLDLTQSFDGLDKKGPDNVVARAMAFYRNNKYEEAKSVLDLNETKDDSLYMFAKGLVLAKLGQMKKSETLFTEGQRILAKDKRKHDLYYYRLLLEGELKSALE